MSNNVTLNASVQANLNSLQNTTALLAEVQNRLSTGKRVNTATDDPVAYFQAKSLTDRASDLSTRKDGIVQGIMALKSASKSLDSMIDLVTQAKSLVVQAKEASAQTTKITSGLDLTANEADVTGSALNANDTFTIKVNDATAKTVTVTAGMSATALATAISEADSAISATYNSSTGKIELTADSGTTVVIADGTGTPLADSSLFTAGTTVFGSTGSGSTITSLETSYKEIMDQIDALRSDASYKGVNLLNGNNLTVLFNEDSSSKLVVSGVTYNHTGIGFTAKASVDWSTAGNIDTAETEVTDALTSLRSQAGVFGNNLSVIQTRETFVNNQIQVLEEGANKLTAADLELESAKLLTLQTRQSIGMQTLSFSNQAQQSILALFR
jgi:flagellin-like hook-associated protein FlgL